MSGIIPDGNIVIRYQDQTFHFNEWEDGLGLPTRSAAIYKGTHTQTSAEVAIKKIKNKTFDDIEREANILRDLSHPHIVRFRGADIDQCYIVMDFIEGDTLGEYRQPFDNTAEAVKTVAFQIFEVLAYLHEKGIIYYDLKPQNLIWNKNYNRLFFVDFGSARRDQIDNEGYTYSYAAPELILRKKPSPEVDLWSAGCVVFFLLKNHLFVHPHSQMQEINQRQIMMQQIVRCIGSPNEAFLSGSENRNDIFYDNLQLKTEWRIDTKPLNESIEEALNNKKVEGEERRTWVDFMSRLIRYENRGTSREYLQHRLFLTLIKVECVIGPGAVISIIGDNLEYPANFTDGRHVCVHLVKSPQNLYEVLYDNDGNIQRKDINIENGQELNISGLFTEDGNEPEQKKSKAGE